jgi:hypothetical protein
MSASGAYQKSTFLSKFTSKLQWRSGSHFILPGAQVLLLKGTIASSAMSPESMVSDDTKIEPTEVLSFLGIPMPFRLKPGSDEEELGPNYPLNFLPIASDMRWPIADFPVAIARRGPYGN